MSFLTRIGGSMSAAYNAALFAWSGSSFPAFGNTGWDDYEARLARYQQNELYYSNEQYTKLNKAMMRLREQRALYVNVRTIYNPINRLVNVYADKVYPAGLDLGTLSTGAFPIDGSPEVVKALIQLFRWSNWNAASVSWNCTPWKSLIDFPNCLRSLVYAIAASSAPWAMPTACAPIVGRV